MIFNFFYVVRLTKKVIKEHYKVLHIALIYAAYGYTYYSLPVIQQFGQAGAQHPTLP